MQCAKCHADNRDGASFCERCGARLVPRCRACDAEVRAGARFCDSCGSALTASAPISQALDIFSQNIDDAPKLEGERKTVTALFADIKGSMSLEEPLDPEEARAFVDPALELMMNAVHRYDGFIVQSTGDGIFAIFGAPVALEDHPHRAINAAIAMQSAIAQHSASLKAQGYPALEIRVGINSGEVVVRPIRTSDAHTEYTPIGHSTGLAARLQTIASPGKIAVSDRTRTLTEGYFTFNPLGPQEMKGVSGKVEVFEVSGLGAARTHFDVSAGRGLSRFVGRDREIAQLEAALEPALDGHGQIAAIVGDAGLGKSRLTFEFKNRVGDRCAIFESVAVSHGKASPYLPIVELLNAYFRICVEDDLATRRRKIRSKLSELDSSLLEIAPQLHALLASSQTNHRGPAPVDQHQIAAAVKRLFVRESIRRPIVLVLEDLHWYDEASRALLKALADAVASARILMLVNYRPDFRHEWGNRSYYTQVRLHPLSKANAVEMLDSILGTGGEIDALKQVIIRRTEGNPFFIEETVQTLFEQGALARNGSVSVTRASVDVAIPSTVQGVLASRIDRLGAREKEMLQTAAVIGKYFNLAVLQEVAARPASEVRAALYNLQLGEFIFEEASANDRAYTFKHALTQEVAYSSLLLERRKHLHARTASALEAIFSGKLEKVYADLARHYEHGGNFERAIDYYVRAGDADRDVLAYREMISHWSHALELAEANHFEEPRLADIVIRLGEAMAPGPDASKYLDRALGIYERVGDEQSQARAHAALAGKFGSTSFDVMDLPRALHHCKRAEDLLRGKPTVELGYAYVAAGWSHGWMADVPKWTDAGYRALEVADALNDNSLRAAALGVVGGSLWARGKIRAAFETLDRGAALARQLQILTTLPITVNAAFNSFHLGDPRGARDWARRATEEPRFRDHPALVTFEINLLLADYLSGNLLEARQLASRYEAIIAAPTLDFVKVFIAYADSDLAEAECAQKRSVEFAAKQGRRENICNEGYGLADYQRHLRMFDESEKTLELVKSVSIEGGYVPFQVRAWEGLAATYARCNRVEKASEALARCREIVSNGEDWRDIFGRIAWTEALLASIEDNAQAATQNFDVAVASAARYENFWDRIWRLMDWADALAKFGQRELATSKFDEATALCRNADAHQPWIDRIASRRVSALGLSLPKTPKG